MDKIMLLDGNSLINRAFYALPVLTNKNGEYTNAVYGFLNIFFKLYDEESPSHVAVAFDLPKPTFRHDRYAEYKAGRKSMPEELRPQIPLLKTLLRKMNIPVYELAGLEADDILGTLAVSCEKAGFLVSVVSGDRDLLQLATERIKIRIPKTKAGKTEVEDYNAADVLSKLGVTPTEYIDVKALMGDASDNIPGVPGIGEKTATKIIQEYKSLENAIANAGAIKPKRASENLVSFREQAILSKELATIVVDAELALDTEAMASPDIYNAAALQEIQRLGFKTFTERFNRGKTAAADGKAYVLVETHAGLKELYARLKTRDTIALALTWVSGECAGLGLAAEGIPGAFVPEALIKDCAEILSLPAGKIMLNSKRDRSYFSRLGMETANLIFDAGLAAYVLNPTLGSYEYSDIAREFLSESVPELPGKAKKDEVSKEALLAAGAAQGDIAYRAYGVLEAELVFNRQDKLYYDMELPLAEVLMDMESHGLHLDKSALYQYGAKLDEAIEVFTSRIYELAGEEFNINSPAQLGKILFEKLGLKGGKKTSLGYSTAAGILEKLLNKHPIIRQILDYRTYVKLKSTYVDGLLAVAEKDTSKVHTTFNQMITATGRLSSTDPNLQNIPVRLPLGRELRKAFVPSEGFVFLDGDYSQIELRVLAHLSGDEELLTAFRQGRDIHRLTASQAFNIPLDEVTPEQRSNAKAVNFGIVYGISAFSLSQDLNISKAEADRYIAGYFEKYPKVKAYMESAVESARERGYAETVFNRRRAIPELKSGNFNVRSFGERVAMNMPVQGSAADIIKLAMLGVYRELKKAGLKSRLVLQVHDELLLEAHKSELPQVRELLKREMEGAVSLDVDMLAQLHEGSTWYEAK